MNIAPVMLNAYTPSYRVNFKGNDKKGPDEPKQPDTASKQNNSPDVHIPPEAYFHLTASSMMDKMQPFAEKNGKKLAEIITEEHEDGDDFGVDGVGEMSDSMVELSAEMAIQALDAASEMIGIVPDELKGKIPVMYQLTADDFIERMEKTVSSLEETGIDFSAAQDEMYQALETNPDFAQVSEEEIAEAENLLEQAQALFENGMMDTIVESQKKMIKLYKTTLYDKLSNAIEKMSESYNYMLYRILDAGFDRNPMDAINAFAQDTMMHTEPKIQDNNDGTSNYLYFANLGLLKVKRNNANKDFISAEFIRGGKKAYDVKFREDGSIERFEYNDEQNGTRIIAKTNPENNKLRVVQQYPDCASIREFARTEDGTLKPVSMRIIAKSEE